MQMCRQLSDNDDNGAGISGAAVLNKNVDYYDEAAQEIAPRWGVDTTDAPRIQMHSIVSMSWSLPVGIRHSILVFAWTMAIVGLAHERSEDTETEPFQSSQEYRIKFYSTDC
ncbi:hypothetical protein TSAR_000653 [Trichomalopsis sarcophagae]|uniref:Uncharacterized protein n=1 Tax=Trichomalopsis sarcophagae TaxID=543379 RepID=A0A232F668_9HYME|nr:hypothetical protein TSAR_000653 [Trichomalopsis sarcophagae]